MKRSTKIILAVAAVAMIGHGVVNDGLGPLAGWMLIILILLAAMGLVAILDRAP